MYFPRLSNRTAERNSSSKRIVRFCNCAVFFFSLPLSKRKKKKKEAQIQKSDERLNNNSAGKQLRGMESTRHRTEALRGFVFVVYDGKKA